MIKKILLVLVGIIIIGICIIGYINYYPSIIINNIENQTLISEYNEKIEKLENIMNSIAYSNLDLPNIKWNQLQKRAFDKNKLQIYDYLVQNINTCYSYSVGDESYLSNSNYLKKFNNIEKINKVDFKKIIEDYQISNTCFEKFKDYKDIINFTDDNLIKTINSVIDGYEQLKSEKIDSYKKLIKIEIQKIDLLTIVANYLQELT